MQDPEVFGVSLTRQGECRRSVPMLGPLRKHEPRLGHRIEHRHVANSTGGAGVAPIGCCLDGSNRLVLRISSGGIIQLVHQQPPEGVAVPVIGANRLEPLDFSHSGGLECLFVVSVFGIHEGQITSDDEVLENRLLIRQILLQSGQQSNRLLRFMILQMSHCQRNIPRRSTGDHGVQLGNCGFAPHQDDDRHQQGDTTSRSHKDSNTTHEPLHEQIDPVTRE